jgi:hypothetical protein
MTRIEPLQLSHPHELVDALVGGKYGVPPDGYTLQAPLP